MGESMGLLVSAVEKLNGLMLFLAGLTLIAMMLLVNADVAAAWILGQPITNVIEIVAFYLMTAIVFLPMGSAEGHDEHIKTDVLVQRLRRGVQLLLSVATGVLMAATLAALTWVSIDKAIAATRQGEMMMGTTLIEIWPSRWLLPIGFGLYAVSVLATMARELQRPRS